MYLTYYVHLVGMKEVTDCRNARCGKFQNKEGNMFLWLSLVLFLHIQVCVGYVLNPSSVWSFSMSFGLLMCHWGFTIAVLITGGDLSLLSCLLWAACSSCIVCLTLLHVLCQLFLLVLYPCLGIHIVPPPVVGQLCIFVTSGVQRRL